MGYFNAASVPHWKQSSRRQIISPLCLVSNSYLKHFDITMAESHWPQTKICSLYQRFNFYIIWKKQYDWQHLVLATHRSFCPTKLHGFSCEWILGNHIISFSPFFCAQVLQHVHKCSWATQYKISLKRINFSLSIHLLKWAWWNFGINFLLP